MRRSIALGAMLLLVGSACGGADEGTDPAAVETTIPVEATEPAAIAPSLPPPPADRYGGGGIAGVSFGAPEEEAVAALTAQLGPPDVDDGWETPAVCGGIGVRILGWLGSPGGLLVHLTDAETAYAPAGTPHVAYWLASGEFGLSSPSGFVPGETTLEEVQAAIGPITFAEEFSASSFSTATPEVGPEAGIEIRVEQVEGRPAMVYSMSAGENPCE